MSLFPVDGQMPTSSGTPVYASYPSQATTANFRDQKVLVARDGTFFCPGSDDSDDKGPRSVANVYGTDTVRVDGGTFIAGGTIEEAHKFALEMQLLQAKLPRRFMATALQRSECAEHWPETAQRDPTDDRKYRAMSANFHSQETFFAEDGVFHAVPGINGNNSVANTDGTKYVQVDGGTFFAGGTIEEVQRFTLQRIRQTMELRNVNNDQWHPIAGLQDQSQDSRRIVDDGLNTDSLSNPSNNHWHSNHSNPPAYTPPPESQGNLAVVATIPEKRASNTTSIWMVCKDIVGGIWNILSAEKFCILAIGLLVAWLR